MVPAVNQIEVHPYFTNEAARSASRDAGILVEAWSPIAQGGVLDDPAIIKIAEHVGRTPAQVTLRWHLQRGDIVFPKSSTPSGWRRTSPCSTSSSTTGDGVDHARSTAARTAAPVRTRTSSTTSRD